MNLAAYRANYDDIQVQIFQAIAPITANGGQGRIQGFEFETQLSPGDGRDVRSQHRLHRRRLHPHRSQRRRSDAGIQIRLRLTLDRDAGCAEGINLGSFGQFNPRVQWTYRSSYFNDALNTPFEEQDSYGLVDGSFQWRDQTAKYSVTFGLKNAFDKAYDLAAYFTRLRPLQRDPGSRPPMVRHLEDRLLTTGQRPHTAPNRGEVGVAKASQAV